MMLRFLLKVLPKKWRNFYSGVPQMGKAERRVSTKMVAFAVTMSAIANVLGLLSIPAGPMKIHFMQLPMILTGLAAGPLAGGFVGFVGALVMAFTTPMGLNPYVPFGNAILGSLTGLFYSRLRKMKGPPVVGQVISALGAFVVQAPYTYVTDVYLMFMPPPAVMIILSALFVEDLVSVLICHLILYRVNVEKILR